MCGVRKILGEHQVRPNNCNALRRGENPVFTPIAFALVVTARNDFGHFGAALGNGFGVFFIFLAFVGITFLGFNLFAFCQCFHFSLQW